MTNKFLVLVLAGLLGACSNPAMSETKPSAPAAHPKSAAPVDFEYTLPASVKAGDEVTTTIRFVATSDLNELVMTAKSYKGLTLVSGGESVVLTGVKKGDVGELDVTVRINDDLGYLAVFAVTTDTRNRTDRKNTAIRFGSPDKTTQKKTNSSTSIKGDTTEQLILMPAELK